MVASISILSSSPIASTPTLPSSPFLFPSLQRAAVPLLSQYFSGWRPNPSDALILFISAHPSTPYSLKKSNLVVLINKKLISNNFDIKLFFCKYFFLSLVPVFQMGVSSGKRDVASLFHYVHKNTLKVTRIAILISCMHHVSIRVQCTACYLLLLWSIL